VHHTPLLYIILEFSATVLVPAQIGFIYRINSYDNVVLLLRLLDT